jgi:hypothetical protein
MKLHRRFHDMHKLSWPLLLLSGKEEREKY